MKITVMGLWHLGSVTAACLASVGNKVIGFDHDPAIVSALNRGVPPLFEPGLENLIKSGIESQNLSFTSDPIQAFENADIVWVTYDTPVDEDDHADPDFVISKIIKIAAYLPSSTLILISSQLPIGSTRILEVEYLHFGKDISFAYSPENLRLGKAIEVFLHPDRIIVGVRFESDRTRIYELLAPITDRIEWMSVESAEMTKHAINAFLATSVVFINEIASLCESFGADAKEVEKGLKSEARIGPKAYLSPGGAFAGGTLARDIAFLIDAGNRNHHPGGLFSAVKSSNDMHKLWPRRKLEELLGDLKGKVVAVWGLTYKPGTDTLRRSSSVELCQWLVGQGAIVQVHDPVVNKKPESLTEVQLCLSAEDALRNASALVLATEWQDYRAFGKDIFLSAMALPNIIDPNGFLSKSLDKIPGIRYVTVGRISENMG